MLNPRRVRQLCPAFHRRQHRHGYGDPVSVMTTVIATGVSTTTTVIATGVSTATAGASTTTVSSIHEAISTFRGKEQA